MGPEWIAIIALVALFVVGTLLPINMGALAYVAAWLVGMYALDLDEKEILAGVSGGLLLGKIYEEAGLPAGVLNVLIARGGTIGDAFVRHPVPRVMSFTGSTEVGRRIMDLAAESPILKRVLLELGGNCPCVVLADADLDLAVHGAVFG